MRLQALAEIYKMHSFAPLWNLSKLNVFKFANLLGKFDKFVEIRGEIAPFGTERSFPDEKKNAHSKSQTNRPK